MLNQKMIKNGIHKLTFMSSAKCTLQCSYCRISQSTNQTAPEMHEKIKKSFHDGSFLTHVLNVLEKAHGGAEYITTIDLWGLEPTTSLADFSIILPDLFKIFPNFNNILFSTNGMQGVDTLFNFILALEENIKAVSKTRLSKKTFVFDLQFSLDGDDEITKINRGADATRITNNIKALVQKLNQVNLEYINVHIYIHNVCTLNLIHNYLNTYEKIKEHFKYFDNLNCDLKTLNHNRKVDIYPAGLGQIIENPFPATTVDGIAYANYLRNCLRLKLQDFKSFTNNLAFWNPFAMFRDAQPVIGDTFDKVLNDLITYQLPYENIAKEHVFQGQTCCTYFGELKICYDGTIIPCQNTIYDQIVEEIPNEKNTLTYQAKTVLTSLMDKPPYNNLDKILNYHQLVTEEGFPIMFCSNINLIYYLAKCQQIPSYYLQNTEKLIRHAYYLTKILGCEYNSITMTGSPHLKGTGFVRLLCNGAMDLFDEYYNIFENPTLEMTIDRSEYIGPSAIKA